MTIHIFSGGVVNQQSILSIDNRGLGSDDPTNVLETTHIGF